MFVDQHSAHERVLYERSDGAAHRRRGAGAAAAPPAHPRSRPTRSWTPSSDTARSWARRIRGRGLRRPIGGAARRADAASPFDAGACFREIVADLAARPVRRLGQRASSDSPRRSPAGRRSRPATGSTRRRCASCCSASSRPTCRRTTCMADRRSCSCPSRSWSAGLAGDRVAGPGAARRRWGRRRSRWRSPLTGRWRSSPRTRARSTAASTSAPPSRRRRERAGSASRRRRRRSRHPVQRRAFRARCDRLDRRGARQRPDAGRGRRHGAVRARAGRGAVSRAGARRRRAAGGSTPGLARLEPLELVRWAGRLDAEFRGGGRQRAARAIEVALLTGAAVALAAGGARERHDRAVVRRAHRAASRAAREDRAAGGRDGSARTDRGGRVGARRRPSGRDAPALDGIGIREAVRVSPRAAAARDGRATPSRPSTRQYAKRQRDVVPPPARADRCSRSTPRGRPNGSPPRSPRPGRGRDG